MNRTRNSLIFIGERLSDKELEVKGKPGFSDALFLTKQQQHSTKNSPYQSIPLEVTSKDLLHIRENTIQITYHQQSLKFSEGENQLTVEDAYNILTNFIVKEGKRISFLSHFPKDRIMPGKRKQGWVLVESKKIECDI